MNYNSLKPFSKKRRIDNGPVNFLNLIEQELQRKQSEQEFLDNICHVQEQCQTLKGFFRHFWPIIRPGMDFVDNWHFDYLCEHLELVAYGGILRLLINIPPRNLKSTLCTTAYPAWRWIKKPAHRIIGASYSQDLSMYFNVQRRNILESDDYLAAFPHIRLSSDQNVKSEYSNTLGGIMKATSVGGSITGKGADELILDDLQKPKNAFSLAERVQATEYYDHTLYSRLDDKNTGSIIAIMQRLHMEDFTNHLLQKQQDGGDEWTHICLPAIFRQRTIFSFPISKREVIIEQKQELSPNREGKKVLKNIYKSLGASNFYAQYLQCPVSIDGNIIKRKFWKYYTQLPDNLDMIVLSMDCSFKKNKGSDPVACQAWGVKGSKRYLIKSIARKASFTETLQIVTRFVTEFPTYSYFLIEAKANGDAVLDVFQKTIPKLKAVNPTVSKVERVNMALPYIECGDVYLPALAIREDEAPVLENWVEDFILKCGNFPDVEHDDDIDAMSQVLIEVDQLSPNIFKAFKIGQKINTYSGEPDAYRNY